MQAIILAAGRGSRLGDKANGLPKCLLEVGRRPLVEHQLDALSAAGIGPVAMVLGYAADEIRERVGLKAEYLFNPEFSSTNSLYSFWLARDWVKGGLVVMNSDILFDPRVLDRLLAAGGDALAFDSTSGDGREHMKVKVEGGLLADMGKELPAADAAGENVGILCFTEATAAALFERAGELVAQGRRKDFLGAAVREIAKVRPIRAIDIAGLPWGEIDFPYDLDRARKEVWPAIARAARRRRPARRVARWAALVLFLAGLGAGVRHLAYRDRGRVTESLEMEGVPAATLASPAGSHRWNLLATGQVARVSGVGPGDLSIDTRLVPGGDFDEAPYVIEVAVDGRRVDWFKLTGRPSRTSRHEGIVVGKSRTITLDLPKGAREVAVRLVAADSGRCLVRVRGVDDGEGAEEGSDESVRASAAGR
ncbi:MAG TPA: phosphocholine cytidylyltransferase family protein [Anaeromyxobacteraceae bacterium]|nr:phosphocholine cytidylyltransferase family protein [Anaeromyxobacteraceae bacterium]